VFLVAAASGVLTGSPSKFEAGNDPTTGLGNMVVDTAGNNDWASVTGDPRYAHVTDLSNSQDNSFVSGQKQDTVCPDVDPAHSNPPKDDFTDVASFTESNTTTGDTYLYGATIRVAPNGSASENVELKQGTAGTCPGSTLLARVAGDKLLAIDYHGGGSVVDFHVLTWVETGSCNVSTDSPPCWGANSLTLTAAGAEGGVSGSDISAAQNPISGVAIKAGQFAEFGVNLATAGVIPSGTCKAFPQTVWESRSSGSSFVSTTKDISIENKTISNCGEIKIIKRSSPRGLDQNFPFTSSLTDPPAPVSSQSSPFCQADNSPSAFTLNDKDGATGDTSNNTEDCTNVQPGNYTVTEGADPSGFVFKTLSCSSTGTGSSGAQDTTVLKQANITIAAGGVVTCIYTNQQQLGAIKITKQTTKSGHAGLANATFTITKGGTPIAGSPFTSGSDGTICVPNLGFADYVVTETAAPNGYHLDDGTGHTVTVDNNAKCDDNPYVGETITFNDTPLTDLLLHVNSEAANGTKSSIDCVDSSKAEIGNSPAGSPANPIDPAEVRADPTHGAALLPGTYTCTVVIDP
jgi:hypothetical protein